MLRRARRRQRVLHRVRGRWRRTGTAWLLRAHRARGARPSKGRPRTAEFTWVPASGRRRKRVRVATLCRLPLQPCRALWVPGTGQLQQALHHSLPARRSCGALHASPGSGRVNSGKSSTYSTNVEPRIIGAKAGDEAPRARHLTVDAESAGQRLDNYLLRVLKGVPKTHVYRVIRSGEVRVNKGRAGADTRVADGDDIRLPPLRLPERSQALPAPAREFAVLFEDDHLLAIDKPAGVAVHGGSGVAFGVIEQLRRARPQAKFLELVHRLDRETSGVLLLAKKRSALTALQDQFRHRGTAKIYAALVFGAWPEALKVIDLALHKASDEAGERNVRVVAADHADGRRSITLVKVAQRCGALTLLDVTIKTGRTHQIRVHLAHSGHPIVGDPKYGDFARNKAYARERTFGRMFLHARELAFDHPASGERITLAAPLPDDCQKLLNP
ncbi:MAG: RluA family pseudouridine synthase [Burkholderiales bacterium]|nr:RluA family pseudouridine synthase [Burkholderiales bacterium]